jgi:hypothetical protein
MLKTFAVGPDPAGIFIYRNEIMAPALKMDVQLDGEPLGTTAARTYLYASVATGTHAVTSSAENTDTLEVHIPVGSLAYVWQEVKMGFFYPRTKLHPMIESEGKQGAIESRLVESAPAMQAIEVRGVAEDPARGGPLECQASNSCETWQSLAPGTVTVQPSTSPLQITCTAPVGAAADAGATVPSGYGASRERPREGATANAVVGAGAGVAMGVAAAPVMGPAFAVLFGVGRALEGADLGAVVGALSAGGRKTYPSPLRRPHQAQIAARRRTEGDRDHVQIGDD